MNKIKKFTAHLVECEKSKATIEKYNRDLRCFSQWLGGRSVNKNVVLKYKEYLIENYATASVNSILSSVNSFLDYNGWSQFKVKTIRIQNQIFLSDERELTKSEYEKLLLTAMEKNNTRLCLLMQTICSTGIRVSELRFITVESVNSGVAEISCKGKHRWAFLPTKLCIMLKKYIKYKKIRSGPVFVSENGNPLNRSNIWSDMKKLCRDAGVAESKVFPHNLRHLFARTYYSAQKDIVRLADILGHSNVNTTRIYTKGTRDIYRKQIQKLGLLDC